jgi:hypothetical protein
MNEVQTQDAQLLEDAIAYYHALLANSRRLSGESVQLFEEQMLLRKLTSDGKPLCNVLRPHFFTRLQFDYLSKACLALTTAIARLGDVIFGQNQAESESLLQSLGITLEERRLLSYDTGYQYSQLDSFLSADGTLRFVGYNAAPLARASEVEALTDLFSELPLMQEFSQRFHLSRFHIPAYEDGTVGMTNSLFRNKMIFGLLTDECNAHYFSPEEQNYIAHHIPWTRRVQPGQTTYQGQVINLEQFIMQNQQRLVLRPNDEYDVKGTVLGWESDAVQWREAYEVALHSSYVVQEKVEVAREPFPVMQNGMIVFTKRSVACESYILGNEVSGVFTRLSSTALPNVTAGRGSVVPTFIIEGRGSGGIRPADSEGCV